MHPFVAAILLGGGGLDELGADAELEPPDAELREATKRARGERLAVIGADARGEAILAKEAAEDQLRRLQARAVESLASQEIPGVRVLDGKRIAVAAIAQLELALEVDRPDDIRAGDRGRRRARMGSALRAAAARDAAMPDEDAVDRRSDGDLVSRVGVEEQLVELAGAPAPGLAELEDLADEGRRGGVGAALGPMRAIGKALGPEAGVALEPLVAGLAADPVAPAELGERAGVCSASSTKRWRWYMGDVTLQGIGASSEAPRLWRCHPSGENKVLPIS